MCDAEISLSNTSFNMSANTLAIILLTLPIKLIGLKSLTLIALCFLGINAINEEKGFFELTVLMKFLKNGKHIYRNHPLTVLQKSHGEAIWTWGFNPLAMFLLCSYLSAIMVRLARDCN